jgi:hypothetical protein
VDIAVKRQEVSYPPSVKKEVAVHIGHDDIDPDIAQAMMIRQTT